MLARSIILAAMIFTPVSHAATYYVRANKGSDSNSGATPASPFKTIGKAVSVAQPGDTVFIAPGTYKESVATVRAGALSSPIRLIGDKTGLNFGVKRGSITVQPGGNAAGVDIGHNYVHIQGLHVTKGGRGVNVSGCVGVVLTDVDSFRNSDGFVITSATATLQRCRARACKDDGVVIDTGGVATISGLLVYSNADCGVVLAAAGASATVRESQIYSNKGCGVLAADGSLTLVNSLVRNNTQDGVRVGGGAGNPAAQIWHCTLVRNRSDGVEQQSGAATLKNTISAFNRGGGVRLVSGTMTHTHNLFYSNTGGDLAGTTLAATELQTSPQFTSKSNYTLLSTSPAINAGDSAQQHTATDLAGFSRPNNGGWDLGCYEGSAAPLFMDVTGSVGFGVTTASSESDGSGLCWADLDDDGDLDCVVTGAQARVMRNNHAGSGFTSTQLGAQRGQGVLLDINNDRRPDLWAIGENAAGNERLFLNEDGVLSASDDCGMNDPTGTEGAAAADLNGDGWMDVVMFGTNGNWSGVNAGSSSPTLAAARPTGLNGAGAMGNGDYCSSGDVNDDGRTDFFFHYNSGKLFVSGESGAYALSPATGGADAEIQIQTGASIRRGSAWGDYDGDGDLDLFVAGYDAGDTGQLFENNGGGSFTDVTEEAGLDPAEGQRGCAWGDVDNDGDLDLYVATHADGCQLYVNLDGQFVLCGLGSEVDVAALDAVFVDYDNDGDLDLALTRNGAGMMLLRNGLNNTRYLKVRVLGAGQGGTNTLGIGTRVELFDSTGTLVGRRDIGVARGFGGTEPLWAHFGGVNPALSYTIKAHFASGVREVLVQPATTTTTIGSRTIAQCVTVEEPPVVSPIRVTRWREASPEE